MKFNFVRPAIVIAMGAVSVPGVHAAGQIPDNDDWNFRVGIPLWAAGTHGTIGAERREVHLDQSFSDTLKSLDCFAALNFELRKDRWLFFSDGEYIKISEHGEPRGLFQSLPLEVQLGSKTMFNDLAIGYTVLKKESIALDVFAGAQLSYSSADLSVNLPIPNRTASASKFWADPIVGIYLNYKFSKPAGFYTKADVGGFDVSSKLLWQVEGGFEFPIAEHWYARAAYRCMSTDFEHGKLTVNTTLRGPQIEFGARF